jgi:hypothetical protein
LGEAARSRLDRVRDRRFLGGGEPAAGSALPNISGFGLSLANCLTPVERKPGRQLFEISVFSPISVGSWMDWFKKV